MEWYSYGPFTIFDIETTGGDPVRDRIVELAAVRVNCDGTLEHFSTLINPGRHITVSATNVHHITDEMVKNAPYFEDIAEEFQSLIAGSTLVAHNARFDLSFIQESFFRCGFPVWEGKTIDSLRLVRKMYPGLDCYKLQSLRGYFGLTSTPGMNPHRAAADVEWTRQLFGIIYTALIETQKKQAN